MAAPEDEEGQDALLVEEEAYRLVLSMQRAAEDAVAFSDLGSVRDLVRAVRRIDPTVVHFTGHGRPGALQFENDKGERDEVPIPILLFNHLLDEFIPSSSIESWHLLTV